MHAHTHAPHARTQPHARPHAPQNDDEVKHWGDKDTGNIRAKSLGKCLMISGFVNEINGFCKLTETEAEELNAQRATAGLEPVSATGCVEFLEPGNNN